MTPHARKLLRTTGLGVALIGLLAFWPLARQDRSGPTAPAPATTDQEASAPSAVAAPDTRVAAPDVNPVLAVTPTAPPDVNPVLAATPTAPPDVTPAPAGVPADARSAAVPLDLVAQPQPHWGEAQGRLPGSPAYPQPQTPAAVKEIVYARSFKLEGAYRTDWRKGRPWVKEGQLLVLKVDPALVFPRDSAEPILYAGAQVAERINIGYPSGYVVAIVPGNVNLEEDPIWFGTPGLPEAVDDEIVRRELAAAKAARIEPALRQRAGATCSSASDALTVKDYRELLRRAGELILVYAPQEEMLGQNLVRPAKALAGTRTLEPNGGEK